MMAMIVLPLLLKNSQVKITEIESVFRKYQPNGSSYCDDVGIKNSGKCQKTQITPIIRLATKGLWHLRSSGKAKPRQPGSSNPPPKIITKSNAIG